MWQTKKLGEICKTSSGGTPSRKNKTFYDGEIPWAKSGELNFNTIRDTDEKISDEAIKQSSAKLFPKGTLLIALYGATVGKLAFLGLDAATNQAVCAIMPKNGLTNKYLYWYLFSKRKDLVGKSIGGAQPNISQTILKDVEVPVPPLPTQHRIVEKIEELFSELENGVENLKKAQQQLKTYRQAVLNDAFEGKLTDEWREQQDDLPTPKELLEQIKAERNAHRQRELTEWEKEVEQWEKDGKPGRKPRKPRNYKNLSDITDEVKRILSEIPEDWVWEKMGNICLKITDGTHHSPENLPNGEYKYITAKNIKENRIDLDDISYVNEEDHKEIYSRCDVKKGDILYIKDGATTGRAAVNTLEEEFSLLSSVGVFRLPKSIDSKFVSHFLNAEVTRKRMLSNISGNAITRLTLTKLNDSLLTIPSLEEQKVIVNEIESRLSVVDQLEQTIKENLQKAEALRQSILKKAFSGELVEK